MYLGVSTKSGWPLFSNRLVVHTMPLHQQALCCIIMAQPIHIRMEWHSSLHQMLLNPHTLLQPQEKHLCMQVKSVKTIISIFILSFNVLSLLWIFLLSLAPCTPAPAYPPLMYSPYTPQPMPYLATGQQYQYPMPVSMLVEHVRFMCIISQSLLLFD